MCSETEQLASPRGREDQPPDENRRDAITAERRPAARGLDLNLLAQVASIVAGGAAFLYVLGGGLLLVRFANADVPAGRAVSLVEGARLLEVGAIVIAGPAVIMIVASVLAFGIVRALPLPRVRRNSSRPPRRLTVSVIGVVGVLLGVMLPRTFAVLVVVVGLGGLGAWMYVRKLDPDTVPALRVGARLGRRLGGCQPRRGGSRRSAVGAGDRGPR